MLNGKKIIVVLPAYNAASTLQKTYLDIPKDIVDEVILTDDRSCDKTVEIARSLNLRVFIHKKNTGYGGNQKTCYKEALRLGADVVVMLHPDYQYPPKLVTAMAALITSGMFDVVIGSRILGNQALKGGMPLYKYIANRILTFIENALIDQKLSEYHTGYRAFSRKVLMDLPLMENSDDFIFDNQILLQAFYFGYNIGEFTSPASYTKESSSINFYRSVIYGVGVLLTTIKFVLQKNLLWKFRIFNKNGRRLF